MPRYNNSFAQPAYHDHTINDADGKKIGTLRVKPSGVLWKPANQQKFFSVSLDEFRPWIEGHPNAKRTTS